MDHSIMVLNAQALRDALALGVPAGEFQSISQKTVQVSSRLLQGVLANPSLGDSMLGFHNNQFMIMSHAAAEIVYVCVCGLVVPLSQEPC